jgi:hypothetical protein
MATQNANAVNIAGGVVSGLGTPLEIASGGTGANSAVAARTSLAAAWTGTSITAGNGLSGGGTLASTVTLSIASNSNGYGTRYVSASTPTGGNNGDLWYQI